MSFDGPFRCYADDNLENGRPYGPHPLDAAYEVARLKSVASEAELTAARAALVVAKANLDASVTVTKTYTADDVIRWYVYVTALEVVRDVTERAYQGGLILLTPERRVTWADLVNNPDSAIRNFAGEYVSNLSGSIGFSLTEGVPFGLDQILKDSLKASLLEKLKTYRDSALSSYNEAVAQGAPSLLAETRFPSPAALAAYNDAKAAVEAAVEQSTVDGHAAFEAQKAAQDAPSDLPPCDSDELKQMLAQAFCPDFDNPFTPDEEAGTPGITARFYARVAQIRALVCDGFAPATAPTLTSLSPAAGPTSGGTVVTLTGTDFTGAGGVTFGSTAASAFTVVSATEITATAPAGTGTVDVTVTTPNGSNANAGTGNDFTYVTAPTVASLSPASGPATGSTVVTLTGTDFTGAVGVSFGSNAASAFTVESATQISATAPAGTGTVELTVTTPGGISATAGIGNDFTYVSAPMVTSLSPVAGPVAGGTIVILTGTDFTGATGVLFGVTPATGFTVDSVTQITATAPAGSGTANVVVETASGVSVSGSDNEFNYLEAPSQPRFEGLRSAYSDTTPTFIGTTSNSAAVMILIDGVEVGPANMPVGGRRFSFTTAALADGEHRISAYASNAGGLSESTDEWPFEVDTVVPDAPVITNPVSGQFLRNVTFVQGTADPDSEVYIYLIGAGNPAAPSGALSNVQGNLIGRSRADGNGNWTLDLDGQNAQSQLGISSVGEVSASIYAVSHDDAGNESDVSAVVEFKIDYVPPVVPTVTSPTQGSTVNTAFPIFTGTAEPASRMTVVLDSLTYGVGTVDNQGNWSISGGNAGALDGAQASPPEGGLTAGAHSFVVISQDTAGNQSTTATITFNVVLLVVTPTTLSDGVVASAYSGTISATGCVGPCTFAVTAGALPAGITLSSSGELAGTPTAGGSFDFTVTATDAGAGDLTAAHAFTLIVAAPTITATATLAAAQRGFAYSQTLVGAGGTSPYTFTLQTGPLPAGITLSSAGVVSGVPTAVGSFPIVVRVTDSSTGSGPYFSDVNLTLVVNAAAITITPTSLPDVMAGVSYDRSLSASGGAGSYSYAVTAGALPTGITLSSAGHVSGNSYQVGDANFTVTATDAFGNTGSVALRLSILARPDPSQDPDVRGLDAAQASATRRLTGTQIDNFSRRLEQLNTGFGDQPVSMGLTMNSGLTQLGQDADQRTRFGGRQSFGQGQVDSDRAELRSMMLANAGLAPAPNGFIGSVVANVGLGADTGMIAGGSNAGPRDAGSAPAGGARFWTGGAITIGERDETTNQARFSIQSSGISMGVDFPVSPTLDLGIGGGFGEERADVGRNDSSVDSSNFVGVAYGSWRPEGGAYFDAMLGLGTLEFDLQRRVSIDNSLVTGQRDGTALFGSVGMGMDRALSSGRINTYGRVEAMNAELDAYTETGSALWALSYAERDVESLQGVLGLRYVLTHLERDSTWTPSFRFEYRREFADGGSQNLQYADWLTGPTYQVQSTGWDRSEFNMGLGLNVTTTPGWNVSSELGARFSSNQSAGTLRMTLSRKF